MAIPPPQNVTQWLLAWSDGDQASLEKLVPVVEAELHRLAEGYLRRERPGHTLQATALVNEAYLRLIGRNDISWQNRAHFFGVAAKLMRRILVDHARRRGYLKRGGGALRVSLAEEEIATPMRDPDLAALDEALETLAAMDPRKGQIVELRFFGGLSVEETAEVLQISTRTVKREWSLAQAWLFCKLNGEHQSDA